MDRGFFHAALACGVLLTLAAPVSFAVPLPAPPSSVARQSAVQPVAGSSLVGPDAIWNPSPQALSAVRAKCFADLSKLGACFAVEMGNAGASPAAVAFAKAVPDGDVAYLRAFRSAGPIGIAYLEYPFRANENEGVYLVNGHPTPINVDDQKALPMATLHADSNYATLLKRYPQVSFWPGDRFRTRSPFVARTPGGVRIIVSYILRDGCHACATVGSARFAFDFDSAGKLRSVQLFAVTPNAAHPSDAASAPRETQASGR